MGAYAGLASKGASGHYKGQCTDGGQNRHGDPLSGKKCAGVLFLTSASGAKLCAGTFQL